MDTPNLGLPYLMAAQAQKHVTHNEALRALDALVQLAVIDRDEATPPASPDNGDRYLVADGATGAWAGHDQELAAFQDGAWTFFAPRAGWRAWIADEAVLVIWDDSAWSPIGGDSGGGDASFDSVGINATADATNKLTVAAPASLFNHAGTGGHQQKINKATVGDTASQLYQTGFSGRAELGLTGDDDFHFKVSPDGSAWHDAILIDKDTGEVSFPSGVDIENPGLPSGGTTGQVLAKASNDDGDVAWATPAGGGDMLASMYDPNEVAADAFDMDNMAEGTDAKIMTAAERTKLAGIEASADVTDATNVAAAGAFMKSADDSDDITEGASKLFMTSAERSKLSGIASGATANSPDATLLARANHTGEQAISTITGLQTALDGKASTSHDHDGSYQPLDADLTAIAGLTTTSFGRAFLALADLAATRVVLKIVAITQEDYDELDPPDADTFYFITDAE